MVRVGNNAVNVWKKVISWRFLFNALVHSSIRSIAVDDIYDCRCQRQRQQTVWGSRGSEDVKNLWFACVKVFKIWLIYLVNLSILCNLVQCVHLKANSAFENKCDSNVTPFKWVFVCSNVKVLIAIFSSHYACHW